jgi:galactonate dehydratase
MPNFAWLEARNTPTENLGFDDSELFPVQPKLEGARFPVPSTPGLGVELDEELAKKQTLKLAEFPHLHRRDGSHTNW